MRGGNGAGVWRAREEGGRWVRGPKDPQRDGGGTAQRDGVAQHERARGLAHVRMRGTREPGGGGLGSADGGSRPHLECR